MSASDTKCVLCRRDPCICSRVRVIPQMPEFDQVAARRFGKADRPADVSLIDTLNAAIGFAKENDPDHVIICFGRTAKEGEGASRTNYMQGGKYTYHGQMGLIFEAGQMIRDNSN